MRDEFNHRRMDFETISPEDFGASLRGIGVNLLVPRVPEEVAFLTKVLGMRAHRQNNDFAIMTYGDQIMQLHADPTYANHPLYAMLTEPPRGIGASLHVFDTDPDKAANAADEAGGIVVQAPANKPHGLRETCLLSPAGYAWVASRALNDQERKDV